MTSLTEEERARIRAVPWPGSLRVAAQVDAERAEREREARAAQAARRDEETLAYAAHTRKRADEETRKHLSGRPCNEMFCRSSDHLASRDPHTRTPDRTVSDLQQRARSPR